MHPHDLFADFSWPTFPFRKIWSSFFKQHIIHEKYMNWQNIEMKYSRKRVFEAVQNNHSNRRFKCYIVLFTERFLSR